MISKFLVCLFLITLLCSIKGENTALFEINDSLHVKVKFKLPEEQIGQDIILKFSTFGQLGSYVFHTNVSSNGLYTPNLTINETPKNRVHIPLNGDLMIGNLNLKNVHIFLMRITLNNSEISPFGVLSIDTIEKLLVNNIWTIYTNRNNSELTFNDLDLNNCYTNYIWFAYKIKNIKTKPYHPEILQKMINCDMKIFGQFFPNMTLLIKDINDESIVLPQSVIKSFENNSLEISYNDVSKRITWNCNYTMPIELHSIDNKTFEFNLYSKRNDNGYCFIQASIGKSNEISIGKSIFYENCASNFLLTNHIGFSKNKKH